MENEELAAIRARADAATPGPWANAGYPLKGIDGPEVMAAGDVHLLTMVCRPADNEGATFIAHARQDVPRLCDEVARLTAEVERLSAMVPRWVKVGTDRAVWRLRVAGQDVGLTQLEPEPDGRWYEWPTSVVHPDLPTACAAVCQRLGLPDIKPPTENP